MLNSDEDVNVIGFSRGAVTVIVFAKAIKRAISPGRDEYQIGWHWFDYRRGMKTLAFITLFLSALAIVGCVSCHRPINAYGSSFQNIGTKKVFVSPFNLYESRAFSEAVCGDLWPGQSKWSGTYYEKPYKQVIVVWKVSDTDEMTNQALDLELPEGFGNVRSSIVFYFDSDNNRAYVAYELRDDKKQTHKIVDSKGKPFDINLIKGSH